MLRLRFLEEQLSNENHNTDDLLILNDANASWIPIYVSMVLTAIQVLVFLLIFECGRRSPSVQQVFDRRRSIWPGRTPPPLMQKRGCCRGWLGFEWWRLRISDEQYNQKARREYQLRSQQQKLKHQEKAADHDGSDEVNFVLQAEQKCYRESPFFDPTETMTMETLLATQQQDTAFFSSTCSIPEETGMEEAKVECDEEEKNNDVDGENDEIREFDSVECDQAEIVHMRETAHPKSTRTLPTSSSSGDLLNNSPDRASRRSLFRPKGIIRARTSASDPTGMSKPERGSQVPLTIGGSERGGSRALRFEDQSSTPKRRRNSTEMGEEGYVAFGTEYAERLAKLRYAKSDVTETWDTATVTTIATFLKQRVLMLTKRQENLDNGYEPEAVSRKVVRRPLTMEQQELLRCVGLDAFMTLRFLKFGFDVSFWPFLFSLITLIPTFATDEDDVVGFFSTTVVALAEGNPRHWVIVVFGWAHFLYILRRIWIEWEIFLPLRYDFLENGDFDRGKYQEQYQKTVVVEYVPHSHRKDKVLYDFFDAIFPGQIERAEVLLDTEYLRSLIKERLDHIIGYEDVFANKVHAQAQYLRQLDSVKNGILIKRCCGSILKPQEPNEPLIRVVNLIPRENTGNVFFNPLRPMVRDCKTYKALPYHHKMIQKITKDIEDEYIRLVREQRKEITQNERESSWISRCLGLDAIFLKNEELRSSTAFVEFKSMVAKEEAIQCNVTGLNHYLQVKEVPDIREIVWENFHIPRSLVEARRWWANIALVGALIAWSFLVAAIRSVNDLSERLGWSNELLATVVDVYLPALLVEGLVRILPFAIKALCVWVRFKAASEVDHYVLKWYFGFRTITFIFVIVGGTIVDSGDEFVDDPMGFFEKLADNLAENVQFFISYVIVAGSVQLFFRLSQIHNIAIHWIINKTTLEEAMSQRRLEKLQTTVKSFHLDEFIPLFVFIFMIGAAYGSLAPLSCFFVAVFFKCSYRIFFYMSLFIYGNKYEGGGFLFYTLTDFLFYILYLLILMISSYLSLHGTGAMAGIFAVLLFVVALVHIDIHRTFVIPSRCLSLTKARLSDKLSKRDSRDRVKEMKTEDEDSAQLLRQNRHRRDTMDEESLRKRLFPQDSSRVSLSAGQDLNLETVEEDLSESLSLQKAIERMERRYVDDLSELSDTECSGPARDFFIYRQPSLNRATWEVAPRPYRDSVRKEKSEVWR